jgi:hypothetical protein
LSNASCNCGAPCYNSHHFFFDCDKYTDNREILFNSLNWLPSNINIDVNLLTKGSDFLTYQENTTIFKHAFKYIKDSKQLSKWSKLRTNTHLQKYLCSFLFFRILSTYVFVYNHSLFIYLYVYYIQYYIISLRMLIHIVNNCIREKTW